MSLTHPSAVFLVFVTLVFYNIVASAVIVRTWRAGGQGRAGGAIHLHKENLPKIKK